MTVLMVIKIVLAVVTILTGLASLIWPRRVQGFTGLHVEGARGITEIRAVLGGGFIGLGAAPLILNVAEAYQVLGITYLVIGAGRVVGMVLDRSLEQSNWISLAFEIVAGVLLLLPA